MSARPKERKRTSVQSSSCLSILQWNSNGLRGRLAQVRDELSRRPYDVLLIQEPKADVADLNISGYTLHTCCGAKKNPCAIPYVNNSLPHCGIDTRDYCSARAEIVGVRIRRGEQEFSVFTCYVHLVGQWRSRAHATIRATETGHIILGGDFNAHNELWGTNRRMRGVGDFSAT
ncbi:uncharacterized protein LOC121046994 [Ixodes scapularis]|uniref:uncharacterized protein LOC121046994 n=1 Tax=Ixodes scapularis TaxID=6945 RepID=UPI001AD7591D|nr:uncharacterized protein LOC121046994 [Ixodes scapularis]